MQDRLGVGYGAVHSVETVPAGLPSLQLLDVHRTLDEIAAAAGPGSKSTKARLLAVLMSAATRPEQVFLQRLILRNLRQGSLEGLMADAVAAAVGVEPAR
ncbi:MAG: ATP-dependent DNA ligase, partial [Acidimicrobiia bacterium]